MLKKIALSFTSLIIIALVPFAMNSTVRNPVINVAGDVTPIYSTTVVSINRTDYGNTITSVFPEDFNIRKYADNVTNNDITRFFEYRTTAKLVNDEINSDYFLIYTNTDTAFNSTNLFNRAGSATNKFRLTDIQMVVSKYNTSLGTETTIELKNDFVSTTNQTIGSFTSTTTETTDASLGANLVTLSKSFLFADNIQQFTILPSSPIVVLSMILTYTIDYSAC